MKKQIALLVILCTLFGEYLVAQDEKPYRAGTIKVVENSRNIRFEMVWHNNTQSNVNFPPYKFKNVRFRNQWVEIVKNEIMSNPDAFRTNWSYEMDILYPDPDADRGDDIPETGGSILNDVLNLLKGDKLVQQDGKICVNGFVDWTKVRLGFDQTSVVPSNVKPGWGEKEVTQQKPSRTNPKPGQSETHIHKDGGVHTKNFDSDGNMVSEDFVGATEITTNKDGSTTSSSEMITQKFDEDGNITESTKNVDKTTLRPNGDTEFETTEEKYKDGVITEKNSSKTTVDKNGDVSTTNVKVQFDKNGEPVKLSIKKEHSNGDYENIEIDLKNDKFEYDSGNKNDKKGNGVKMTTDGTGGGPNVALCFPVEMINLMLNWNKLGAAVTDPSPITDEEIMSETLDTAPIDPQKYEVGWTPSVKYLNILEGGGVTDPPKHDD